MALQRGLLDAADPAGGGGAQGDRDSQRLVVVQQQRWQGLARPQGIAASDPAAGRNRIAQLAQPVDITTQGARMHGQALGQLGPGPMASGLQQGQAGAAVARRHSTSGHYSGH
jgi:hypothetical protein